LKHAFITGARALALLALAAACPPPVARAAGEAVNVTVVADEAEAVLAILAKRSAGRGVVEADWERLFASEGYVRLKRREAGMGRAFDEAEFKAFVLSDDLASRAAALEETLARWKRADVTGAARRALAYLPPGATIRAKVYPSIKPRDNSFVFEVKTDPAIFLYLDPAVSAERFENTLAHELHHIGYGTCCPTAEAAAAAEKLPEGARAALGWLGAFGEGLAMLAAAGGPDVHPHAASPAEDRERWDRDVARFDADLRRVEGFLLDVAAGRLDEKAARETGFSFFGVQGPWYTVGWRMAVTIERALGRDRLIDCMRDARLLLPTYNEAAARSGQALWSRELLDGLASP
jgi:hypothetical protein